MEGRRQSQVMQAYGNFDEALVASPSRPFRVHSALALVPPPLVPTVHVVCE